MISLKENIVKQIHLLNEIERLSNPSMYYLQASHKPALNCDKRNRRHLKNAIKKLKRLTIVIEKQVLNGEVIKYYLRKK